MIGDTSSWISKVAMVSLVLPHSSIAVKVTVTAPVSAHLSDNEPAL